jgi:sugar phosphate isomerase/epimerase
MKSKINRRQFTRSAAITGIASFGMPLFLKGNSHAPEDLHVPRPGNLKISLNAYSFDKPLRAGTLTIDNLLDYCAATGFDGVDLTGYYFPGYPAAPPDEFIHNVRRKAFRLGLGISGTGVKNDFTWADTVKREPEKKLVKDWIIVAEKMGAPLVRIFAGTLLKENFKWEDRAKWIAADIDECAEFGKKHGVMLALQNHNDFLKTSSDVDNLMNMLKSDWTGLLLDIGSYHTADPYQDITLNSKRAISWQLKEKVFVNNNQVDTDYQKIIEIVKLSGYSGYLPLETLGEGDPAQKVEALFKRVQKVMG